MNEFTTHNPFTGITEATFPQLTDKELDSKLVHAQVSFSAWNKTSFSERGAYFLKLAELIKKNQHDLAVLATREMGKTYREAIAEILKCTTACVHYATHAETILQTTLTTADTGKQVEIRYQPMGVVLGIFPWNFPYWQIIRSAVPVLMAGNTMLVKPSPNVPQCSMALQKLFDEAGVPQHVVQTVFINETQIQRIIADDRVKACTLTGSEKAGSVVAAAAAKHIKKSVLELGGSDPFIVFEDADLKAAAEIAITARFQNNGQSCIASKRFILHKDIADSFLELLKEKVSQLRLGDPMSEDTHIGPLARPDLRDKLQQQVDDSIRAGATLFYQHPSKPESGYFFPPTILTNVPKLTPAYDEELFGPVISVFTFAQADEAIRIANDTTFGLGACVWSNDTKRANAVAVELDCGQVFINGLVKSHTAFPFGGNKHSGIGRELGDWGLKEFSNIKTIWT